MRDVLALGMIGIGAALALFYPWLGILAWTTISIMNPHRYAWSASELPVAAAIAIATLAGIWISRERVRITVTPIVVVFVAFALWMCFTLPSSLYYDRSFLMWKQVMKIDFMILVAIMVLHTRKHIIALVWVLVGSIGIYGVKGGIFVIATGGDYRVWGPPESFIEGNNELALALVMTIPLMRFLQMQYESFWVRHGLTLAMLLAATAALGTHSRGALLAILAMAFVFWARNRGKLVTGALLVVVGASLIAFMPGQWESRMESILRYEEDASAQGRINAWYMAWNLASDRFLGGGFDIYKLDVFARYAPIPDDVHAAHSIYFQVLGEHGFVGLALFLVMWLLVWRGAGWLRRNGLAHPESKWTSDLGSMIQASIAGYAIGGAFLSLAYFDLPYNLLLLVVITRRWIGEKAWDTEGVPAAGPARAPSRKGQTRAPVSQAANTSSSTPT